MTVLQLAYIERFLVRFDITASSPIPAGPAVELMSREAEEEDCSEPFCEAVGGLMWVTNMSPFDVANVGLKVAR